MSRLLFKITETFWMEGIGLVVDVDAKYADVSLRAGDQLELRRPDGSRLETAVAAIARVRPDYPDRPFSFSLPGGVRKADVPVGTEVWANVRDETKTDVRWNKD
jgi:hypothetical protein